MKTIEANEIIEKLTMTKCLELMETALRDFSSGVSIQPLRWNVGLPHDSLMMLMPGYLGDDDYFGTKVISSYPGNAGTEYETHSGAILLFDSKYGILKTAVDANAITEIRTGAVSGVATNLLARKDAHNLAIIGAGVQARSHLTAMMLIRQIKQVKVFDLRAESAVKFAEEMKEKFGLPITVCDTVQETVADADIICCLTSSREPYLEAEWVKEGAHINAVGAFSKTTREVTSNIVVKSKFYADSIESIMGECGEFLIPKAEGRIGDEHIIGEIGEILLGKIPGRENELEITLFDALGLAVEDLTCAKYLTDLKT